jgi:hypothetical protein
MVLNNESRCVMAIEQEGSIGSVGSSPDVQLVTLSDTADFQIDPSNTGIFPRAWWVTSDGGIKITTARGTTLVLPVVANKDYLIQVKRFWAESFTAGECYAIP